MKIIPRFLALGAVGGATKGVSCRRVTIFPFRGLIAILLLFDQQFFFPQPQYTTRLIMICSGGESSISRYAGVGRQLLPDKLLKEILKKWTPYFWYALAWTQIFNA